MVRASSYNPGMAEGPVALFWGEDEFLLRLGAHALFEEKRIQATDVEAREWEGDELSDLATPSLWGERRALLIRGAQALPESGLREVREYLQSPAPDAVFVLTWVSRGRNPPPLAKAVQAAGGLVKQVALKRQEVPRWVMQRAKARGLRLTPPAAATLVGVIGDDPAALDQAVEQLRSAFPGRPVDPEAVHAQFRGLGEQQVWDLSDRAFEGRTADALVVLRSLLQNRQHDPLVILGGIASRVRDLIRVRSLPERMPPADAARAAGLRFDWQVRRYREQSRRFTPEDLNDVHDWVVQADRAIKGGAPPEVVLTGLIAAMAGHRDAALDLPMRVSR
jgi:DNA polymerase III subunit delta